MDRILHFILIKHLMGMFCGKTYERKQEEFVTFTGIPFTISNVIIMLEKYLNPDNKNLTLSKLKHLQTAK